MGLDDKLTHKEAMAIYGSLALGFTIGFATCSNRTTEYQELSSNTQTVETSRSIDNTTKDAKTFNPQSLENRPFKYNNRVYLYGGYDQNRSMFRFMIDNNNTYLSWNQFNAIPFQNVTYISMSTYGNYMQSHGWGSRMSTRPPGMFRYWNSVNMASGAYNNVNDTTYIKNNENRLGNKVRNWIKNRKNK